MIIETKFLGNTTIDKKDIIQIPNGLPGFEEIKKFVVLPLEAESPFAILQSVEQKEIGFVIAFPFLFKPDYSFDLAQEDKDELRVEQPEDLITYSIVTLKSPFNNSTMNLQAPILINYKKKIAKQLVLQDSNLYPLRFPLEGSRA